MTMWHYAVLYRSRRANGALSVIEIKSPFSSGSGGYEDAVEKAQQHPFVTEVLGVVRLSSGGHQIKAVTPPVRLSIGGRIFSIGEPE